MELAIIFLFCLQLFFGEKGSLQLCEKRLHLINELCLKLPESDPLRTTSQSSQKSLSELKSLVASTYMKLMDHPDKWKDYKDRYYLSDSGKDVIKPWWR